MIAFGGLRAALVPAATGGVAVWGALHLPSVGASILLCSAFTQIVGGHAIWPLVGFAATGAYLLVLGVQCWLAARRGPPGEAAATTPSGSGCG
ncbi:MAG: hypothetical protein GEV09_09190 [Pseudonocardiaceae bacterium]|nr:hypothetical protein [Pseudonocardiaceae bacterium]